MHCAITMAGGYGHARLREWAFGGGLYHIGCNYRLMVDNLMDLTHETYVHATSIGQKEIDEVPCTTKVDGDDLDPDHNPFRYPALRGGERGNKAVWAAERLREFGVRTRRLLLSRALPTI